MEQTAAWPGAEATRQSTSLGSVPAEKRAFKFAKENASCVLGAKIKKVLQRNI